jgi:hypothetical protein
VRVGLQDTALAQLEWQSADAVNEETIPFYRALEDGDRRRRERRLGRRRDRDRGGEG